MPTEVRSNAIGVPSKRIVAIVPRLICSQALAQLCQQITSGCILTIGRSVILEQSEHCNAGHIAATSDQPGGNWDTMHLIVFSVSSSNLAGPNITNTPKSLVELGSVGGVNGAHHPVACTQGACGPCGPPAGRLKRGISSFVDRACPVENEIVELAILGLHV